MTTINTPLSLDKIKSLKAGEELLLTGTIYTARDQAHKRLVEAIKKGARLPIELKNAVIYYCGPTQRLKGKVIGSCGPTKTPRGKVIGACGPTTSSRMDSFTPALLKAGLRGMIGKGNRAEEVKKAIKQHQGIYFLTYAGCGALLAKYVKKATPIAYRDLGPEAIFKLEVKDFPLIVGIDSKGGCIYGKI